MNLLSLKASNFLRLEAVEITPCSQISALAKLMEGEQP